MESRREQRPFLLAECGAFNRPGDEHDFSLYAGAATVRPCPSRARRLPLPDPPAAHPFASPWARKTPAERGLSEEWFMGLEPTTSAWHVWAAFAPVRSRSLKAIAGRSWARPNTSEPDRTTSVTIVTTRLTLRTHSSSSAHPLESRVDLVARGADALTVVETRFLPFLPPRRRSACSYPVTVSPSYVWWSFVSSCASSTGLK
jgi:hypothetical protein